MKKFCATVCPKCQRNVPYQSPENTTSKYNLLKCRHCGRRKLGCICGRQLIKKQGKAKEGSGDEFKTPKLMIIIGIFFSLLGIGWLIFNMKTKQDKASATIENKDKVAVNTQTELPGHDIGYTAHEIEELTAKIKEKCRQIEFKPQDRISEIIEKIVIVYKLEMIQAGDTPKEKQVVKKKINDLFKSETGTDLLDIEPENLKAPAPSATSSESILVFFEKNGIWKVDRENHRCMVDVGVWQLFPFEKKEQTLEVIYREENTWWELYDMYSGKTIGKVSSWGVKVYP